MSGMFTQGFQALSEKIASASAVTTSVTGASSIILPEHCNKVDIIKTTLSGKKRLSTSPPLSPDGDHTNDKKDMKKKEKEKKKKKEDKKKKKEKKVVSSPSSNSSSSSSSSCDSSPSRHKKKKKRDKNYGDRVYNVKMNFGDRN